MRSKYPLQEGAMKIIQHKEILNKMMDPEGGEDYGDLLTDMCKGNLSLTKRMAKSYLKGMNRTYNGLDGCLKSLANFLLVDD